MHQVQLIIDGTYTINLPYWILSIMIGLMLLGSWSPKR